MQLQFEIELEVSAEAAWNLAAERFGDTGLWTSALDSSYMVGKTDVGGHRVCNQGNKRLVERITKYQEENMLIEYELSEGRPFILKSASNQWVVTAIDKSRSKLSMQPSMEAKWWAVWLLPLLALGLKSILPGVIEEFKYMLENGAPHPKKLAYDAKFVKSG